MEKKQKDAAFADELALEDSRAIRNLRIEIEAMAAAEKAHRLAHRVSFLASELAETGDEELIEWGDALRSYLGDIALLPSLVGDLESVAERVEQRTTRSPWKGSEEIPIARTWPRSNPKP